MTNTQTIKGYELREELGRGGYGAVYMAHQASIARDVAVKVILPQFANQPDFIRRFEVEAQTVARLEHPFIVPLFDYWRDPEGAFLVMRWIRGGSLLQVLRRREYISLEDTHSYLRQMGAALAFAHRSGVVHRDLKPGNILLDQENNAYLSDFGIAQVQDSNIENLAEGGALVGSPGYLAPEQIMGEPATGRSDIYSLAVMLFEMLTGQHPYQEPGKAVSALLVDHLNNPLPSAKDINPALPYGLDSVLAQATAKDPEDRFEDMTAFVSAFSDVVAPPNTEQDIIEIGALPVENPYKGLRAFDEADADDFYGREKLVGELVEHFSTPSNRFLTVVGPSGSGKSSVVRAGLVPALRGGRAPGSEEWFFADMVPGTNPILQLENALESIATSEIHDLHQQLTANPAGLVQVVNEVLGDQPGEFMLLVDQFEEVFTLAATEADREQFLNILHAAVTQPGSRLRVIVTLRADFYDRPLLYNEFGSLVQEHTQVVLPLGASEIERVITLPASNANITVDTDLIAAIIDDVREEPGALPLLQYALTELFEMREENRLTLAAYQASGGVVGALARRAEQVYQKIPTSLQPLVRQLFLRLITLGEGREDTRRRVARSELYSITEDRTNLDEMLKAFGRFRLLTFDQDPETREPMVEVAHEALIREWARLQAWLNTMRDDIRLQRVLAASATEWVNANRDFSYLMRGGQLAQYEEWVKETSIALTENERDFLQSSLTQRQREQNREAAQRQREKRQRRWLGRLSVVALIVALVAAGLAVLAFDQRAAAQRERDNAQAARATSEAEAIRAENAVATATTALGQAEVRANELQSVALLSNAQSSEDSAPSLTLGLAVAANRVTNAPLQALETLYQLAYRPGPRRLLGQHDGAVLALATHDDQVASGGADNTIRIWHTGASDVTNVLNGHEADVLALGWSSDGDILLSGGADGTAIVWDPATATIRHTLEAHDRAIQAVALSPDGTLAATGGDDSRVILWDVATGDIQQELVGHANRVRALAFSPDGEALLTGGADDSLLLWDVTDGTIIRRFGGHDATVTAIAYLNQRIAISGSGGGRLIIWNLETGEPRREVRAHEGGIWDIALFEDGDFLTASGGVAEDTEAEFGELTLWSGTTAIPLATYRAHNGRVRAVVATTEGSVTASDDGNILLWEMETINSAKQQVSESSGAVAAALSADGSRLYTSGGLLSPADMTTVAGSNVITAWDTATGQEQDQYTTSELSPRTIIPLAGTDQLLIAGDSGLLSRLDLTTGDVTTLARHESSIWGVAVDAGQTYAATAGLDQQVIVWDLAANEEQLRIEGYGPVRDVSFGPEGRLLALAANDVIVWNLVTGSEHMRHSTNSPVTSVAYQPGGTQLAFGTQDNIGGIISNAGTRLAEWEAAAPINRIRYRPDGRLIATSSMQGVQLWQADTGDEVHHFTHRAPAWGLAFSPGNTYLWAASQDGNVRQYPVASVTLADWTEANRYIPAFTCEQRRAYRLPITPACEE